MRSFGWAALGQLTESMYSSYEEKIQEDQKRLHAATQNSTIEVKSDNARSAEIKTAPPQRLLDKLLNELNMINPNDAGRIGTMIQKIELLEAVGEKAAMAAAIRDKLGPKAFKKHKRKDYLESLIQDS